ncbi:MAG: hypothetical protein FJZ92_07820 [Chloroflexi bacterium]|nr:hypothetical protein [Chloroflexota bacterium]
MTSRRRRADPRQPSLLAPRSAAELEQACAEIARALGLQVRRQVKVGRRVYGPERHIDVVVTDLQSRRSLGIECKFQRGKGTAEEKIPATIEDIRAWPIEGLVCFAGGGFSAHMVSFMYASGRAVDLEDLEDWLRLYFVI